MGCDSPLPNAANDELPLSCSAEVVAFILSVVDHEWPSSESQRVQLFTAYHRGPRSAYEALLEAVTDEFGSPMDQWADDEVPPRIWQIGDRDVTLHFFYRRDSTVMLSIENRAVAERAERFAQDKARGKWT